MATLTIRQNDPRLAAIKAELLHGIPELTGSQINRAAFLAVVAINRLNELNETNKPESLKLLNPHLGWKSVMSSSEGHE